MEDRYLFKAKDCNSIWRAGLLIGLQEGRCAIEEKDGSKWACNSKTICQCTGLKDKNGKLIWENDITLRTSVTGTHKGKIIYSSDGSFCQKDFETTFENLLIHSESYFEVIGNIFDNPELINE